MAFEYSRIKTVHLEITSRCNASCPQCGRNVLGTWVNPSLPITELTLDDCKKIFTKEFLLSLNRIYMCGNFGDPIAAQDTLDVMKYFREMNPNITLGMNTNGSAKNPEWWGELGKLLSKKGDSVRFGIDGLDDTNHLYRQGCRFDVIMRNVESFIQSGGRAIWDYIVFKHNEHQVDDARTLAAEMGFIHFQVKKTGRFFSNNQLKGKDSQDVMGKDGTVKHVLEKPIDPQYQNNALQQEQSLIAKHGSLQNYLDNTPITCKTDTEGSIYISAEGLVFPCCWTANQLYVWYLEPKSSPLWKIIEHVGGKDAINGIMVSVEKILAGPMFNYIESTWSKPSCAAGKLKVCAKTCGKDFDPFGDQFK